MTLALASAVYAPAAVAAQDTPNISPLGMPGAPPPTPVGVVEPRAAGEAMTAAAGDEPALALPEYVLPAVEVRALRTLSAPDSPILAWTDTDTRGVHRHEADATSLRLALNFSWVNPFNW